MTISQLYACMKWIIIIIIHISIYVFACFSASEFFYVFPYRCAFVQFVDLLKMVREKPNNYNLNSNFQAFCLLCDYDYARFYCVCEWGVGATINKSIIDFHFLFLFRPFACCAVALLCYPLLLLFLFLRRQMVCNLFTVFSVCSNSKSSSVDCSIYFMLCVLCLCVPCNFSSEMEAKNGNNSISDERKIRNKRVKKEQNRNGQQQKHDNENKQRREHRYTLAHTLARNANWFPWKNYQVCQSICVYVVVQHQILQFHFRNGLNIRNNNEHSSNYWTYSLESDTIPHLRLKRHDTHNTQ